MTNVNLGNLKLTWGNARLEGDKGIDPLACDVVVDTDNSSLCDTLVEDQRGFDLSGGKTMSGDVDDIWVPFSLPSLEHNRHSTHRLRDP